jgi:glycosyltransferase involved in cell wall biosynthesis
LSVKTKILYIHHGKGVGGAPLSLLYLVKNLDKSKYSTTVLFLQDSPAVNLFKKNNVEVVGPIGVCDFPHTKIWWFRWYHVHHILRSTYDQLKTWLFVADYWLNKINPDIIHLNTSSLLAWGIVARKKNIPVVWHIREPLAGGYFGIRKKLIKFCVKKYASFILPICSNDAKPWANNKKTEIVYNAVDSKKFYPEISCQKFLKENSLNPEHPKILFLGGLSREKGTLQIFKIFKLVLEKLPKTKLLVAGYFDLSPAARSFKKFFPASKFKQQSEIELSKIKNSVVFLGPIDCVPQAMQACNLVAFPATVGHFARPIIEAGFMQKPVVASAMPPLDELVKNEKTGFLINPNNTGKWAEKVILLLSNDQICKNLGIQNYEFCTKNFDIKTQVAKIEKIYSKAVLT